ncbi:MAG: LPS export ABC transporter permease LptF [Gammaproteobacteria bacterium]|nr:LPS export ABC transporter permease LptF [Gammaproteobacteria bacterium]
MIIRRTLYWEMTKATVAIVAVLVVVFVLFGMTSLLAHTVSGDYAERVVFVLLGWQTVRRLDLLLPLGFYLGVLLTFSRWYRDSEMTVLAACGIGLPQLLRPVLVSAAAMASLVAVAAFYVSPYAMRALDQVKAEGASRPEITGVDPGAFTEAGEGGRVVYAESTDGQGRLQQVFISNPKDGRPSVILARSGHPFADERTGDHFMALADGWAYDGVPGQPDYRMVKFESYAVRIDIKPIVPVPDTIQTLPAMALLALNNADASAEWHWRLSKPLFVFVLAIFALVMAHTDARRGRLANLFAAILVYFIYSNLLGVGQTLMRKGYVSGSVGLWWVHASMLAVAAYLFYRRSRNWPLFPRLGRRGR